MADTFIFVSCVVLSVTGDGSFPPAGLGRFLDGCMGGGSGGFFFRRSRVWLVVRLLTKYGLGWKDFSSIGGDTRMAGDSPAKAPVGDLGVWWIGAVFVFFTSFCLLHEDKNVYTYSVNVNQVRGHRSGIKCSLREMPKKAEPTSYNHWHHF